MQCGQWPIWQWRLLIQAWTMMPVWCTMWVKVSVAWQWQVWIGTLTRYRCWEIMTLSLDWGQWQWVAKVDIDVSLECDQWIWKYWQDTSKIFGRIDMILPKYLEELTILPKYLEEMTRFFQNIWKIQMQLCCGCCCGLNPLFKPLPFSPNLP